MRVWASLIVLLWARAGLAGPSASEPKRIALDPQN
jgi:hypothetical protein